MDREKTIKEFEEICGYTMRPHEFRVLNDVLILLKEQQNRKEFYMNDKTDSIVFSLKEARKAIEQAANESDILKKYGHDSVPYLYYAKGIRDACWTIDDIIEKLEEGKK